MARERDILFLAIGFATARTRTASSRSPCDHGAEFAPDRQREPGEGGVASRASTWWASRQARALPRSWCSAWWPSSGAGYHPDVSEFEVVQEDVRFMLPKEIRVARRAQEGASLRRYVAAGTMGVNCNTCAGGVLVIPLRRSCPFRRAQARSRRRIALRRPRRRRTLEAGGGTGVGRGDPVLAVGAVRTLEGGRARPAALCPRSAVEQRAGHVLGAQRLHQAPRRRRGHSPTAHSVSSYSPSP